MQHYRTQRCVAVDPILCSFTPVTKVFH